MGGPSAQRCFPVTLVPHVHLQHIPGKLISVAVAPGGKYVVGANRENQVFGHDGGSQARPAPSPPPPLTRHPPPMVTVLVWRMLAVVEGSRAHPSCAPRS